MSPKLQYGPKVLGIVFPLLSLLHMIRGGPISPYKLDDKIDPSFDPKFLEKYLEPDSEKYRNISCPKYWHMKETLAILDLHEHPGKEYILTTEDGYIMSLYRITPNRVNATPVLFLHGFVASPETWMMRGKEDLPIVLADAGYDVWLSTYRGSHNGRRHVNLTTEDEKFWDFSFHEHGYYDVPVVIDKILEVTGFQRVQVIAHSMGNTVIMVTLALRPEYNDKVGVIVGMAPYVKTQLSPRIRRTTEMIIGVLNHNFNTKKTDLFRRRKINAMVGVCWSLPRLCVTLKPKLDVAWKIVPVSLGYFPSGTSNKCTKHMYDMRNGDFVQYDYGLNQNLVRYNRATPPGYNLNNVRVPVSLYYGGKDSLVHPRNIERLVPALPNVVSTRILPTYHYVDFLVGRTTAELLYKDIIQDLKKYAT